MTTIRWVKGWVLERANVLKWVAMKLKIAQFPFWQYQWYNLSVSQLRKRRIFSQQWNMILHETKTHLHTLPPTPSPSPPVSNYQIQDFKSRWTETRLMKLVTNGKRFPSSEVQLILSDRNLREIHSEGWQNNYIQYNCKIVYFHHFHVCWLWIN